MSDRRGSLHPLNIEQDPANIRGGVLFYVASYQLLRSRDRSAVHSPTSKPRWPRPRF